MDVWSDIACPWCYIGRRRFALGVEQYAATDGARPVQVTYHSFELSPDTPVDYEGSSTDFLASHRGIPIEDARAMNAQVAQLAQAVDLTFDADATHHTNTRRMHEVLHLARERDVQDAVVGRLLRAYWGEGRDLRHDDELADLAAEAGLDRTEVLEALADRRYSAAVDGDVAQAAAYGIRGVPFYVLDHRYGISGAQDPAVFARALTRAAADRAATPTP